MKASIPEPSPKPKGSPVTPALLIWLSQNVKDQAALESASDLVTQRDIFGRNKYGQPLMSGDGRDGLEDLKQEIGDALQYAFKCRINGREIKDEILPLVLVLKQLVELE